MTSQPNEEPVLPEMPRYRLVSDWAYPYIGIDDIEYDDAGMPRYHSTYGVVRIHSKTIDGYLGELREVLTALCYPVLKAQDGQGCDPTVYTETSEMIAPHILEQVKALICLLPEG